MECEAGGGAAPPAAHDEGYAYARARGRARRAAKGDAIGALLRLKGTAPPLAAAPAPAPALAPAEHDFDDDAASLDVQDAASTASAPLPAPPTRRRRAPRKPLSDAPAALRAAYVREILLSSLEL